MRLLLARTIETLGIWLMHLADTIDPPRPCDCGLGRGVLISDEQLVHIAQQRTAPRMN